MSQTTRKSDKPLRWEGPNKRMARRHKLQVCVEAAAAGVIPANAGALTFAGAKGHFERGLVSRGITTSARIDTIQTCKPRGSHDTEAVLRTLIDLRNDCLPGMAIWPHEFHDFSLGYHQDRYETPPFVFRSRAPNWYRKPSFRREMEAFLTRKPPRYHILDIDLCGMFSQENAEDIARLFYRGAPADAGVLFINHTKGRDNPGGKLKLFDFLRDYFHSCNYFDLDSLVDQSGLRPDFDQPDELTWWYVRRVMAPIYYLCEAFEAGYSLSIKHLVEYRDKNNWTHAGIVMLQWFFDFERRRSVDLLNQQQMAGYAEALQVERETLARQLSLASREAYHYIEAID